MRPFKRPFIGTAFFPLVIAAILSCFGYVSSSFAQVDISISGNMDVTGDLSLSTVGKGVVFPDASRQTTAGQKKYVSTVVISPGATDADSGTALRNAIDAIADATEATPYLIKIEPGIYDIGTSALQMKQYVDVEGSGETVTKILGTVAGSTTGVVVTADRMELISLTVENDSKGEYVIAIYNASGSPRLSHVTALIKTAMVVAAGEEVIKLKAPPTPVSHRYGIYNDSVSADLRNITVDVGGTNYSYGIYNLDCGSYLTMNLISIRVIFGTYCYGLYNRDSSPTITGLSSQASYGTTCYGIYNYSVLSTSAPFLFNVITQASECSNAYGIYNSTASPTMTNLIAKATGGTTTNRGMMNIGSTSTIKADRCSFIGASYSIYNDTDFTLYFGASKLDGPANTATGTWQCGQCYNGNYLTLPSNCAEL